MTNSSSDFNSPEFKEYNPTPYCGGYDQTLNYGKPLPPSDSICYPPSFSLSNSPSLNGFSFGSIPSPYGTNMMDRTSQSQNGSSPIKPCKEEEKKNNLGCDGNGNWVYGSNSWGEDIFSNGCGYGYGSVACGDGHGSDYGEAIDTYQPWSDYGYGREEESCNYGRQEETQDDQGPCAGIFGYWPCLYKKDHKSNYRRNGNEQEGHGNQWKGTAEYLFGRSLYPYGERKDEDVSYGYDIYGYDRHYRKPSELVQVEYNEESLFQKPVYHEAYQDESHPASKYLNSESDLSIHHGYERHYQKQSHFVHVENNEQSSFQKPGYYEAYPNPEERYPASKYGTSKSNLVIHHGYERHYQEPPHFVQVEYNEQSSFQTPGYYEAFPEEGYPASE